MLQSRNNCITILVIWQNNKQATKLFNVYQDMQIHNYAVTFYWDDQCFIWSMVA